MNPVRALVVALFAALVGGYWFASGTAAEPWWYLVAITVGVATMAGGLLTRRRSVTAPWWVLLGGVVAWAAGDAWWSVTAIRGEEVDWVSPADVGYVLEYLLLVGGLGWTAKRMTAERDVDAALDVLAVLVAGVFAMWALVLEPSLQEEGVPGLARALGIAYPILDAVLVALLVRILLVPGVRNRSLLFIGIGVGLTFAADAGYSVIVQTGSYLEGAGLAVVLDMAWMASIGMFGLAALHPSMKDVGRRTTAPPQLNPWHMVVTGVGFALPIPVALASWAIGGSFRPVEFMLAVGALTVIAVLRLVRLLLASQRYREHIQHAEAYYRAMAQNSSDAVLVLSADGVVRDASPALLRLFGYQPDDVVGLRALDFIHAEDRARAADEFVGTLDAIGDVHVVEVRMRRGDGTLGWYEARVTNLTDDNAVRGVVVNLHDISTWKRAEAELAHQAFHDALTGLANRALFHDRVQHALARLARRGGDVAVLFCDLDGFKNINDSLGHAVGDDLLREVSTRIQQVTRDEDTVARLGGDEFAILLEGPDAARRADEVAARVLRAVSAPLAIEETTVTPGISIGVACAGAEALTADELLRDADTAMYSAKASGKNRAARFEESMRTAAVERLALEADLRVATAGEQLRLRLQPIVELRDGRLTGFEALVRWQHPTRGLLAPISFVPFAEETGEIIEIGAWVLRRACLLAAAWTDETLDISVNVSGRELDDPSYPGRVADALAESGLRPERLVLEVTETTVIEDPEAVAARLAGLKDLGVRIAIDDFGTGYSSLQYLRRFPIDILKIDRSFVDGIVGTDELPPIVRGLLELGRTLELELLAEGIETEGQLDGLAAGGCGLGQGFLFARPLEPADADALVRAAESLSPSEPVA